MLGQKDSFLEFESGSEGHFPTGKRRVFSFGRKTLPPANKEDVYDSITEYKERMEQKDEPRRKKSRD